MKFAARLFFVIFSVLSLVFFLQRMMPGSPADAVLGADAPQYQKQLWLQQQGLDRPLSVQYVDYLSATLRGDLGKKIVDGKPIAPLVADRLLVTSKLAGTAFSISLLLALLMGVLGAVHSGRKLDDALSLLSLLMVSAPLFITGTLLLWVFAVQLNVLPLTGAAGVTALILPSVTLGLALAASTSRLVRSALLDVLHEDYIRTARAKGVGLRGIYFKHALRNALLPAVSVLGLQFAGLLGGAVITEQVFTWPGLGSLLIEGVNQRDYNLVSACVIVLALIHVSVSAAVDLIQKWLDPRTVNA